MPPHVVKRRAILLDVRGDHGCSTRARRSFEKVEQRLREGLSSIPADRKVGDMPRGAVGRSA